MRIALILLIAVALLGCGSYDAHESTPEPTTDAAAGVAAPPDEEEESETACKNNEDCATGEFCAKALGDCDGEGTCKTKPEICTHNWDPVCGCDDKTYGNSCAAAAKGVNVAAKGECRSE
jgi:hypothetical protein